MPIWQVKSTTMPHRTCASSWTMRWSAALRRPLLARTPKTLVLDLGGVGFMDSSGVGLILGRQRCARSLGGTLRIQHAPEQLRRVLRLANIPCTDAGQEE